MMGFLKEAPPSKGEGSLRPQTSEAVPKLPHAQEACTSAQGKWPGFGSCYLASAMDTGQGDFKWQGGMGRVTLHCRVPVTGPSADVTAPTWMVQTSRNRDVCPATHTQLPDQQPEAEVAAQESISLLLGE